MEKQPKFEISAGVLWQVWVFLKFPFRLKPRH